MVCKFSCTIFSKSLLTATPVAIAASEYDGGSGSSGIWARLAADAGGWSIRYVRQYQRKGRCRHRARRERVAEGEARQGDQTSFGRSTWRGWGEACRRRGVSDSLRGGGKKGGKWRKHLLWSFTREETGLSGDDLEGKLREFDYMTLIADRRVSPRAGVLYDQLSSFENAIFPWFLRAWV